jgi:hypothetical protein
MDDEDNRLQKIITETFQDFFNSKIMAPMLELLRASEQRIDDTNKMIQRLSEICEHYTTLYSEHITSLERSRDKALDCSSELVTANVGLAEQLAKARKELDDVRREYSERLNDTLARNYDIINKYAKLSEAMVNNSGRNSAELRADINVKK